MATGSGSPSSAEKWIFRDDGNRPGAEQMAIDAALLAAVAEGTSGPVFRVYGWSPPAISLGMNQDPARELDLDLVAARGYDVVRRPTGGRAILHKDELTYSVVAGVDDLHLGGSIRESHAAISRVFLEVLGRLGVKAELACDAPPGRGPATERPAVVRTPGAASVPCFATALSCELTVGGRKILGSAQRRQGSAFLQHGSLLLGDGHLELAELLRTPDPMSSRNRLEETTTTVSREMGRRMTADEVKPVLTEVLSCLPLRLTPP
jgi:lipoate-protein ligase A